MLKRLESKGLVTRRRRAMRNFLSDSPDDMTLAGPWMSFESAFSGET